MLDLPIDVDDVAVENAPLRRHVHDGLTIEGWSRAAVQTYWRCPELKIGFDFGLQPWSFMTTETWALSHSHLDHIAALPVYVARRRMMKMAPPTIFLPESMVPDIEQLLRVIVRLDRGRLPCTLVPCQPGDEFDLSRETVLTAFATRHTVPSLGFIVWDRRRKLKLEYLGLTGNEIRDLRLSGVDVTNEVRKPMLAYLGDSDPTPFDQHPELYQAKILILELTFVSPEHKKEHIHKYGHIHVDDLAERADRFANELIVASHFSTRYTDQQIKRLAEKRLPEQLRQRMVFWI